MKEYDDLKQCTFAPILNDFKDQQNAEKLQEVKGMDKFMYHIENK